MFTITKNGRPVHLNLLQIKLPVPAVMSILHRASGALLSVAVPFGIYLLDLSLRGPEGYAKAQLLLDIDVGIEKPTYRWSAWAVLLAAPPLALLLTWGMLS